MRSSLLLIATLAFGASTQAQLTAGEVPAGASAVDQNINLLLSAPFSADSAGLEIDCDDFPDIMAMLISGAPPIDAPNVALLRLIDTDLEVLADGNSSASRPLFLDAGEPIVPSGDFDWQSGEYFTLGDFGSFTAIGPVQISSQYIGVRRGAQVAWVQLSFLLNNALSVSLQVHNALSFCGLTTALAENDQERMRLAPSISHGEPIRVVTTEPWLRIEVLDAAGRTVARHAAGGAFIPPPDASGTYTLRIWQASGPPLLARLVRY